MTPGRLYRRASQIVVSPAVPRVSAGLSFEARLLCGYYPVSALSVGPGSGLESTVYTGLNYDLLRTAPPAGAIVVEPNAGTSVFGGYGAGASVFGPRPNAYAFICGVLSVPVVLSDVPAVPPTVRMAIAPGWNASALSSAAFTKYGRVSFRVRPGEQMLVGLQQGDPLNPATKFIGLHFQGDGLVRDIKRGTSLGASTETDLLGGHTFFSTGIAYNETTLFTIEILRPSNGAPLLTIKRDNVTLLNFAATEADLSGVWNLGAAMFSPGAWVEGVQVAQYIGADLILPKLAMRAGSGTAKSGAALVFPRLALAGRKATRAAASLPRLKLRASDYALAEAALVLPALTATSVELRATAGPGAFIRLPRPAVAGHALTGQVGFATLATRPMLMRGGRKLADAYLQLPMPAMYGAASLADESAIFGNGRASPTMAPFVEIAVLMNSAGDITSVMAVGYVLDANASSASSAAATATVTAVYESLMQTVMSAGADQGDANAPVQAWAVNLANNATSTFDDYPFNSFGVIGGRAFGVKADGLFELVGDTDAGAAIRASVSYGKQDFGTKTMKHMARAYVGASSEGTLYLKIVANGVEHIYAARTSSTSLEQQRFDVGRGLQANYFTFEVFNHDGGDFEIDSASFFAAEFNRRI